jgi:protein phosphatase 1 regulatory subunit 37
MCRDILNTCIRNTEEAEKATQVAKPESAGGRGQNKGMWVMLEESELAKTLREGDKKKVEAQAPDASSFTLKGEDGTDCDSAFVEQDTTLNVISLAKTCKKELEDMLASIPSASSSPTATPMTDEDLTARAKETVKSLTGLIESTDNDATMQQLLALHDDITYLLARIHQPRSGLQTVEGLGIQLESQTNGVKATDAYTIADKDDEDDEDKPIMSRADKGKQRAEPEPEEPQLVLTPTVEQHPEFDDPDVEHDVEQSILEEAEGIVSPTDRYLSHVNDLAVVE